MAISFSSILATVTDPLLLAGTVIVAGFFGARYGQRRGPLAYFIVQLLVFVILTGLLLAAGVAPYRPGVTIGSEPRRLIVGALEAIWWLGAAWLAVGFLRAFVVLGRQPRESKLVQDLLAGLIYLVATFAIIAYVFDLPVKGLLATSGALAIIIGLALQSSLGDVFSGIVLNIERPYRVGDWIILDDTLQGKVIETNWRATHILTGNQDVAIIPNSVIAKSRLVNCSAPTKTHGTRIRVKLEPSLTPAAGVSEGSNLMRMLAPWILDGVLQFTSLDFAMTLFGMIATSWFPVRMCVARQLVSITLPWTLSSRMIQSPTR